MPSCSPNPAETRHLTSVLDAYVRDEVWLRVKRVYDLALQPAQFTADVTDATGTVLRDACGLERSHTFQLTSPNLHLEPGQRLRLTRDGQSVQVQALPQRGLDVDSSGTSSWVGLRTEGSPAS
jgi:hypothetical protein